MFRDSYQLPEQVKLLGFVGLFELFYLLFLGNKPCAIDLDFSLNQSRLSNLDEWSQLLRRPPEEVAFDLFLHRWQITFDLV